MRIVGHDIAIQGVVPVSYSGSVDIEFDLIELSRESYISRQFETGNYNTYRVSRMDDFAHVPALIAEIPNQNLLVDLYVSTIPDQPVS